MISNNHPEKSGLPLFGEDRQGQVRTVRVTREAVQREFARTTAIAGMAYEGLPTLFDRFGPGHVLDTIQDVQTRTHGHFAMYDVVRRLAPTRAERAEIYDQIRYRAKLVAGSIDFARTMPEWARSPFFNEDPGDIFVGRVERNVEAMEARDRSPITWGVRMAVGNILGLREPRREHAQRPTASTLEDFANLLADPSDRQRLDAELQVHGGSFYEVIAYEDNANHRLAAMAEDLGVEQRATVQPAI